MTFAEPLAHAMTGGGDSTSFAAQYLRVVGWSLGGYGLAATANAAMTSRSEARWAVALSLLRIGVLYIPLAWLCVWTLGYTGILAAAITSNIAAIGASRGLRYFGLALLAQLLGARLIHLHLHKRRLVPALMAALLLVWGIYQVM